jgi:hypothetical protein
MLSAEELFEQEQQQLAHAGRGRGRGRGGGGGGGVPLLPKGVWESLHSTEHVNDDEEAIDSFLKDTTGNSKEQFKDPEEQDKRLHQSAEGAVPGVEKDMKGKDWNCPSCQNLNWSWRTNCNMCSTPKPFSTTAKVKLSMI